MSLWICNLNSKSLQTKALLPHRKKVSISRWRDLLSPLPAQFLPANLHCRLLTASSALVFIWALHRLLKSPSPIPGTRPRTPQPHCGEGPWWTRRRMTCAWRASTTSVGSTKWSLRSRCCWRCTSFGPSCRWWWCSWPATVSITIIPSQGKQVMGRWRSWPDSQKSYWKSGLLSSVD